MNERRRPFRRGRGQRPPGPRANEPYGDADPYREPMEPPVPGTDNFDIPAPRTDANGASSDDSSDFRPPVDPGPPPPDTAEPTSPQYSNQPNQTTYPNQQQNQQQNQRQQLRRRPGWTSEQRSRYPQQRPTQSAKPTRPRSQSPAATAATAAAAARPGTTPANGANRPRWRNHGLV